MLHIFFEHFFPQNNDSVNSKNEEQWIPIIKSTYPENVLFPQSKIVVCDLHFETKYILGSEKRKLLVPGAILSVGCAFNIFRIF